MKRARLLLLLTLLALPGFAEPRSLYTDVVARLRGAELELGILERQVTDRKPPTTRDWERTTQTLTRLEAVWTQAEQDLSEVESPKHKELWQQTRELLTLQQELAKLCAFIVQGRYMLGDPKLASQVDPAELERAQSRLLGIRTSYDKLRSDLSRRL